MKYNIISNNITKPMDLHIILILKIASLELFDLIVFWSILFLSNDFAVITPTYMIFIIKCNFKALEFQTVVLCHLHQLHQKESWFLLMIINTVHFLLLWIWCEP